MTLGATCAIPTLIDTTPETSIVRTPSAQATSKQVRYGKEERGNE